MRWSAVITMFVIMLLWSEVGGQLRTRSLEDPAAELSGKNCVDQYVFGTRLVFEVAVRRV